jgi:hypothetical protein
MATQDYAASIQGVCIRVTRLDASGNLLNGPGDSYVTSAFMRLSFTPEYEEGDEITEKSANGTVCVTYKSPDTLKRITMELAICEPDPELTNLVSGGLLLRKNIGTFGTPNNQSVGWAAPGVGDDPAGYGVSIEAWSIAVKDGKRASSLPYFHWVFPYAKLRQSGDRVLENGLLANTFEGYGLGNSNFGSAPDGRWEFPTATERPYSYARTSFAPQGLKGFYTWNYAGEAPTENTTYNEVTNLDAVNAKVTSAVLATNQVTLTTLANHSMTTGKTVVVSGVDPAVAVSKKAKTGTTATITTSTVHNFVVGDVVATNVGDAAFDAVVGIQTVPDTTSYTYKAPISGTVTEVTTAGTATRKLFNGSYTTVATTSGNTITYNIPSTVASISAAGDGTTHTYTSAAAHNLVSGQFVTITGFTGTDATKFNVTGNAANNITVTSTTTFTVTPASAGLTANLTNATGGGSGAIVRDTAETTNASSTPAISGAALATSDTTTTSATAGYNVPGNISFNPDNPIDRVIKSNEDPTA